MAYINIPENFRNNMFADRKFKELVQFFNDMSSKVEAASTEDEAIKVLRKYQDELIMWGIL